MYVMCIIKGLCFQSLYNACYLNYNDHFATGSFLKFSNVNKSIKLIVIDSFLQLTRRVSSRNVLKRSNRSQLWDGLVTITLVEGKKLNSCDDNGKMFRYMLLEYYYRYKG